MVAHIYHDSANVTVDFGPTFDVGTTAHADFLYFVEGIVEVTQPLPGIAHNVLIFGRQRTEERYEISRLVKRVQAVHIFDILESLSLIEWSQQPGIILHDTAEVIQLKPLTALIRYVHLLPRITDLLPNSVSGDKCC